MSLQSSQVFDLMRSAYAHGVIDKSLPLVGQSMETVIERTGLSMEDLLNNMDAAEEKTVRRVDRLLGHAGPVLKLLSSDIVMRITSRLLDIRLVQRAAVFVISRGMQKSLLREGSAS